VLAVYDVERDAARGQYKITCPECGETTVIDVSLIQPHWTLEGTISRCAHHRPGCSHRR
jgi:endogenous inhibitor of DNA gyrase (YacG/DUF329 family)